MLFATLSWKRTTNPQARCHSSLRRSVSACQGWKWVWQGWGNEWTREYLQQPRRKSVLINMNAFPQFITTFTSHSYVKRLAQECLDNPEICPLTESVSYFTHINSPLENEPAQPFPFDDGENNPNLPDSTGSQWGLAKCENSDRDILLPGSADTTAAYSVFHNRRWRELVDRLLARILFQVFSPIMIFRCWH